MTKLCKFLIVAFPDGRIAAHAEPVPETDSGVVIEGARMLVDALGGTLTVAEVMVELPDPPMSDLVRSTIENTMAKIVRDQS